MHTVEAVEDAASCRRLWERFIPSETIWDLWEMRQAFNRRYKRRSLFLVHETDGKPDGLLPLSWIDESGCYGYFPGETYNGRTWLEQNRLCSSDPASARRLLGAVPGPCHLRYLVDPGRTLPTAKQDECGYLFFPERYGYDMGRYFGEFSGKNAKRLRREEAAILDRRHSFMLDRFEDFDLMVGMNDQRYGENSYFYDPCFREAFRDICDLFALRGQLRSTTLFIEGEPAAVDFGILFNGVYTLLAGGTNDRFPGVAKVMNLFHMRRACDEKMGHVDFLCGEFNWKPLFHLTARPLYLVARARSKVA